VPPALRGLTAQPLSCFARLRPPSRPLPWKESGRRRRLVELRPSACNAAGDSCPRIIIEIAAAAAREAKANGGNKTSDVPQNGTTEKRDPKLLMLHKMEQQKKGTAT
jgi:hypothetical protein